MPGKSKHGKGKRYQINKKRNIARQNTVATPAAATAAAPKPAAALAAAPAVKAPAGKAAALAASMKTDQYAHVPGDLRRIGLLTGIIIIILIVLRFVMP
jgi:hypothetical protein